MFKFFVWHPGRMWAVSAVFIVLFLAALIAKGRYPQLRSLPLLVASLVWFILGFLERDALIHKANIRIDIVCLWPLVFGLTAVLIAISCVSFLCAINRHRKL